MGVRSDAHTSTISTCKIWVNMGVVTPLPYYCNAGGS